MRMRVQRITIISLCVLLAVMTMFAARQRSAAVAPQNTGNLQVDPQPESSEKSISTRIVMVSVLKEGKVVKQKEVGMSNLPLNFTLPVGVYDVRLEGEGLSTMFKRGVHVTEGDSTNLLPAMRSGTGVCECKYAP